MREHKQWMRNKCLSARDLRDLFDGQQPCPMTEQELHERDTARSYLHGHLNDYPPIVSYEPIKLPKSIQALLRLGAIDEALDEIDRSWTAEREIESFCN